MLREVPMRMYSSLTERMNVLREQTKLQAPVVQRLDNAIHRINHYPVETNQPIHWIVICPVDSVVQPLNNPGQMFPLVSGRHDVSIINTIISVIPFAE